MNPTKPIAAFIEYTIKPLLDDARELIVLCGEKGFSREDLKLAYSLFIAQMVLDFIKGILITGLICLTLLHILSPYPIILK